MIFLVQYYISIFIFLPSGFVKHVSIVTHVSVVTLIVFRSVNSDQTIYFDLGTFRYFITLNLRICSSDDRMMFNLMN